MNTKIKMLVFVALTWLITFSLAYFAATSLNSYISALFFIALSLIGAFTSFKIISVFSNKTIEQLNQVIKNQEEEIDKHKKGSVTGSHFKEEKIENASNSPHAHVAHETTSTHYDVVTSLPNRAFFNALLNKSISYAKRHQHILAILLIEVEMGNIDAPLRDELLKEIGSKFAKTLRSEDTLAKLDGNEFVVLLTDINKTKFASTVAEKILQARAEPFAVNGQYRHVTARIGISIYPSDGDTLEDLLKYADSALYKASLQKANSYEFYTESMSIEARAFIQIEHDLRNAIKNHELTLYYQPQLNIKKGKITGIETLLRWEHPEHGLILPNTFIGIAEETGLIMQIGEWVIHEACRISKYWQTEGYEHVTVSVNLSPKQLYHPNLFNIITNALNEHQLNPKFLELELAEKIVMDDADAVATILDKIKTTGVQLSIDHFGTGYISVSHLKRLPISTIKIDQSFIKGIPNNPNDLAIVSAFISLAHHLGLAAVAEGVETEDQVYFLSDQHCDIIQGYFLSHPLPAQKIKLQLNKLSDETLL